MLSNRPGPGSRPTMTEIKSYARSCITFIEFYFEIHLKYCMNTSNQCFAVARFSRKWEKSEENIYCSTRGHTCWTFDEMTQKYIDLNAKTMEILEKSFPPSSMSLLGLGKIFLFIFSSDFILRAFCCLTNIYKSIILYGCLQCSNFVFFFMINK